MHRLVDVTMMMVFINIFPKRLRDLGFRMYQAINAEGNDVARCVLPPLVRVPAGPFLMGRAQSKVSRTPLYTAPQQTLALAANRIAQYPLTTAEYACFVRAVPERVPLGWDKQFVPALLDYPVVALSWLDVRAYGQWLSDLAGKVWRMPTEAEWEKAARGTDGRIYPWGNNWDARRANTREDGRAVRWTPVGAFAEQGDKSPYGCHDMVGSVWEWTSSIWRESIYRDDKRHEWEKDTTLPRVLRGGSRHGLATDARTDTRARTTPSYRGEGYGGRLVCGPREASVPSFT